MIVSSFSCHQSEMVPVEELCPAGTSNNCAGTNRTCTAFQAHREREKKADVHDLTDGRQEVRRPRNSTDDAASVFKT
jgi:hypothetical protein